MKIHFLDPLFLRHPGHIKRLINIREVRSDRKWSNVHKRSLGLQIYANSLSSGLSTPNVDWEIRISINTCLVEFRAYHIWEPSVNRGDKSLGIC